MRYIPYTNATMRRIPQFKKLSPEKQHELDVLSRVFHFKTNNYVVNKLIDWDHYEDDPMFALNFPRKEMLEEHDFVLMSRLLNGKMPDEIIKNYAQNIKIHLAHQQATEATDLIRIDEPDGIAGLYHQFPRTMLAVTAGSQTCHAYCNYCYRWMAYTFDDVHFHYSDPRVPVNYLRVHPEVSDILFSGGDALHMTAAELKKFVSPLLEIDSVRTIRLGTRTLTWWPYRFLTESDADELLAFFEFIISKGKHVSLVAHITHPRELGTTAAQNAVRRIQSAGAVIRCQCPIIKQLNDSAATWIELIKREIQLGLIPYYMFVESSKTFNSAFKVPFFTALQIYQETCKAVSGLGKTLRGPVLTNGSFKILIDGIAEIGGKKVFVLKVLQASNPLLEGNIYFAAYDETITHFEQLRPALGERHFLKPIKIRSMA